MSRMDPNQLAEAYLAEKHIEGLQSYVLNGRRFEFYTQDGLEAHFCKSYRGLVLFDDDRNWDDVMDLHCEFDLRRIEPPMHLVAAESALFKARLERLEAEGPPDPEVWQDIRAELIELRERLSRPKH